MSEIELAMIESSNAMRNNIIDVSSKKLCHYTSPSGLLGIFDSQTPSLFLTEYDSLNDTKERKDIFEILKKYCDKQLAEQKISEELYNDILSISQSDLFAITRIIDEELLLSNGEKVKGITSSSDEECHTYICSFSKNNDSLPMWRMYSKAEHYEGFCIEFSPSAFSENYNNFSLELVKVIYNEKKKLDLIENVLSPIIKHYDSANKRDKEYLLSILKFMIKRFQFVFKNKSFSYEKEIRAILHIPKTEKSIEGKISERKYRQSNGLIVPYVKYNIDKIHVKSITLAPTIKEQTAINNLEDYLCSKNMNHVNIIASDIPIRSV